MRMPIRLSPRIAITAAAILTAGTAGAVGVASTAGATPSTSHVRSASCNLGTLQGTYLFDASGYLVSGSTSLLGGWRVLPASTRLPPE